MQIEMRDAFIANLLDESQSRSSNKQPPRLQRATNW